MKVVDTLALISFPSASADDKTFSFPSLPDDEAELERTENM